MKKLLTYNTVELQVDANTWKDAIEVSGNLLVKENKVEKAYINDAIEVVEKFGPYIVITNGVAIAHGRPSENVKEDAISLITLKKPVNFNCDKDPVYVVLTLAATSKSNHIEALGSIAEFLSDEKNIKYLMEEKDKEKVLKAINV
ncbi:PTS sugar transporter subunit IIA [Clostridium hydrogeniformans]|uniref:PTS sugar transporter subunit IIA n=1 Tax=Clostridium hydrogeniformans TaxID=349933 RepID=UPI00055449B8|nr:PTS sugar transporter subunit IIA [Clostridium hydrogeniformans]